MQVEKEISSIDDLRNYDLTGDTVIDEPIKNDDGVIEQEQKKVEPIPTTDHAEIDFKPSFVYKVKDEEFQFDDRVKSVIKSKADEDYFRDIYTKASGLDTYKQKVGAYESQINELTSGLDELSQGFHRIKELRDSGKMDELVHTLGLKDEDIVNYALEIARLNQLPQEEKKVIQQARDYERENRELKSKLSQVENTYKTTTYEKSVQQDFQELQSMVSSASDLAEAMRSKGIDLQAEVINVGMSEFGRRGEDISIKDAFQIVVNKYGWLKDINKQPVQKELPRIDEKDTLPIIKGGNSVPVSQEITSIEQLQELYSRFN
jgi:putative lipoic acid-binding regulatory protein